MLSGWEIFLEASIKVLVVFLLLLTITIVLVWMERKVVADMQNRVGPDRAGPWGILQTVADGVKLLFKESVTPRKVEFGLYIVAPIAFGIIGDRFGLTPAMITMACMVLFPLALCPLMRPALARKYA